MESSEYLYGNLAEYYIDIQKELCEQKIFCAERTLAEITSVAPEFRDTKRYTAIRKAIKFNIELLKEFEGEL